MTRNHQHIYNDRGFTLVEVLVAIAIFAIMSVLAYGGLNSVIASQEQTEQALVRLKQLQLTISKLQRDIEQAAARDGKDELGGTLWKISSNPDTDELLGLTRNGWRNPANQTRSHLQRVAYQLDEDRLVRYTWPYVDRAQDSQATELILIDNLESVEVRFYSDEGEWVNSWPTAQVQTSGDPVPLPRAVEITLELGDWGKVVRIFRVTG